MFKIFVRNILIMIGIAVPVLLITSPFVWWLLPSAWGGSERKAQLPPFNPFLDSLMAWYPIWALLAAVVAILHQPILATIPKDWHPRTRRLMILATALGMEGLVVAYVATQTTERHVLAFALALLPGAVVYGLLAQPILKTTGSDTLREGGEGTRDSS